jgi:hypothetical protein
LVASLHESEEGTLSIGSIESNDDISALRGGSGRRRRGGTTSADGDDDHQRSSSKGDEQSVSSRRTTKSSRDLPPNRSSRRRRNSSESDSLSRTPSPDLTRDSRSTNNLSSSPAVTQGQEAPISVRRITKERKPRPPRERGERTRSPNNSPTRAKSSPVRVAPVRSKSFDLQF